VSERRKGKPRKGGGGAGTGNKRRNANAKGRKAVPSVVKEGPPTGTVPASGEPAPAATRRDTPVPAYLPDKPSREGEREDPAVGMPDESPAAPVADRSRSGGDVVLDQAALNRAFLARQLLMERATMSPLTAVEHLVGMQAQAPNAPYVGLWTRLAGFGFDDLANLVLGRQVVRLAMMRSTIHLVSARDCFVLRPVLQPVLDRGLSGGFGRRLTGLDLPAVAARGREFVEEAPQTWAGLGARLAAEWPEHDADALAQVIRASLPLVQLPPRGVWGEGGAALHTTAHHYLGVAAAADASVEDLVRRYLGAYGPASVRDVQAWSGLTRLADVLEGMRRELAVFRDLTGRELFDLPDAPRPPGSRPAPVRFLPEFDNALLAHHDRSRILPVEHKGRVFSNNGYVAGTVLVDGAVRATWRVARDRGFATCTVQLLADVSQAQRREIATEGSLLLRVVASGLRGIVAFA
jgi:DNA glycosylase AlkZ-like